MDSFDSGIALSSEASTDERASSPLSGGPPAACLPVQADFAGHRFATPAEQEAYWIGVRAGAEAARAGAALPAIRHRPAELDFELTRDSDLPGLVSTRLTDPGAAQSGPARALRHDGWTPEKERIFFLTLASTGVVADACRACGMSRDSAYSRRNRASGRAFALAWDAAHILARPALADDLQSRVRHGVIDKIYRNGELVAERHRHDNRLAMAVLTRLDRLAESLKERMPAVQAVAEEFEQFLGLLPEGNKAAEAFLALRLGDRPLEPPHAQDWDYSEQDGLTTMARAAHYERHGAGLPAEIDVDGLNPEEMESWSDDQLRRAEGSGLLASLDDRAWPDCALRDEADGTDGMCKLRKLYLSVKESQWNVFEDE
jgi:hypothetical protein